MSIYVTLFINDSSRIGVTLFKVAFFFNSQLTAVRMIPWAKANLNYTAQALIISGGMISS